MFKVTTDSVLLGAWADIESAGSVLDIGTGTGLLALMAAQRSASRIVAIEPDCDSFLQAGVNITGSPWSERITLLNTSVQDYNPEGGAGFDAIITNPPYFIDSLLNPEENKARARHTVTLTQADLLEAAGVDTVVELGNRKADNLVKKMEEVNAAKKLVRRLPTLKMVEDWIKQAKALPRVMTY